IAGIENWIKAAPYKAAAIINYWYDDIGEGYDLEEMVMQQPDEAAVWIEDLFRSDSVTPSMLS
ncbi:MAG TPA: hypothetical protein DHW34_01765, partial [Actinobacteria bacterium]|nr:hypothetical protein [Actinomycetota bacterium]